MNLTRLPMETWRLLELFASTHRPSPSLYLRAAITCNNAGGTEMPLQNWKPYGEYSKHGEAQLIAFLSVGPFVATRATFARIPDIARTLATPFDVTVAHAWLSCNCPRCCDTGRFQARLLLPCWFLAKERRNVF